MCLGLGNGYQIQDGDRYELVKYGQRFPYVAKQTPNGIVLVHDSKTPLGIPLGAVHVSEMYKYDFEKVESK